MSGPCECFQDVIFYERLNKPFQLRSFFLELPRTAITPETSLTSSSSPSTTLLSDLVIPQIQLVDEQVKLTRNSQLELANHIESLNETLIQGY